MTVHQLFPEPPAEAPDLREVHKRVESYRTSKWPLTQAHRDAIALDDAVAVMHEAMGAERILAAVHATTDAHELIAEQERTIASLRRQLREPM